MAKQKWKQRIKGSKAYEDTRKEWGLPYGGHMKQQELRERKQADNRSQAHRLRRKGA